MPKAKKSSAAKAQRNDPLAEQILEAADKVGLRKTPREKQSRRRNGEEDEDTGALPADITRKVMEIAQAQKAEDEEDGLVDEEVEGAADGASAIDDGGTVGALSDVDVDDEGYVLAHGATEEEERALALFLPKGGDKPAAKTLADVILEKIAEKEEAKARGEAAAAAKDASGGLSPKVVQVYSEIGKWMKHYKQGKMPKAFKIVPKLNNWEEILSLTNPLSWSPNAMYEAVKVFASNMNPRMAQRFYNLVLLPAVREDLATHKKLNFHYYRALNKALFKPAAFFKGIVLPLAQENCTLREASIISAVLMKASVPIVHASAVVVRLSQMSPWYGTTSIFITCLLNKKYALPIKVVGALTDHFRSFEADHRALPVIWHASLLVFVQRYKFDVTPEQRRGLLNLVKVHWHDGIGPEVRRELTAPRPGEVPSSAGGMDVDG